MDASLSHRDLNLTYTQFKVAARHLGGAKQREIASDLRLAQSTVSKHLERARRRNPELFKRFGGFENGDGRTRRTVSPISQLEETKRTAFCERLGLN